MADFERVESVVRVVIGRPVSYLAYGIMVASERLYRLTSGLVKRMCQSKKAGGISTGR